MTVQSTHPQKRRIPGMWQLREPLINSFQDITNSVESIVFTSSHLLQAYEQFR